MTILNFSMCLTLIMMDIVVMVDISKPTKTIFAFGKIKRENVVRNKISVQINPKKIIRMPLVGGLRWWWRTVLANRGAAVAVASLFLYVLSGLYPEPFHAVARTCRT
jgi:hypothetical protein